MNSRSYIKKKIQLCGESDGVFFRRTFQIAKKINEGGSVICYEAYHENSAHGILKEWYPTNIYGISRDDSGQLINAPEFPDARNRFRSEMAEYLRPYEMLLTAKRQEDTRDLATFIPPFEIYRGCDDAGCPTGTAYIWTPEPQLETFDKLCEQIHKHPTQRPEHKLVTVLTAIDSLAKCVRALHAAELLHRDIKPSNFGFIKRGDDTLTQTLSMFDINTICSVYDSRDVVGTVGYLEPENVFATNQSDIYSIGATLFHAVIVCEETKENDYLFKSDFYDRIQELVDNSALIQASEANAHPRLRNILAKIMQKCLCGRIDRYNNCEELIEDLDTALYYALPAEIAQKQKNGLTWVLADAEKALDANGDKNSALAIQQLLFTHPLYEYATDTDINILIVGFGNYGQKFLDAVLQVGQMRDKKLNIMVVSDEVTDKQIYLAERPVLNKFFNIDGSMNGSDEAYGDVTFSFAKLERGNLAANADLLRKLTSEHYQSGALQYIFVALGDDRLNKSAANACLQVVDACEGKCTVSYIQESVSMVHAQEKLVPVCINEDISQTPFFKEIERMAFNTHLVWEKNLNIDARVVKAEFKKKYNYHSCISSVLSLKYKLFSMGIDLDQLNYEQAARQFVFIISDKKNREIKNELMWVEHRRWVTEKICLGWQCVSDLNSCAYGITKDEKSKRHVCILRSRPDQKLATEYKVNGTYDKWDTATDAELAQLDDLDRMSVLLHRVFAEKAAELKRKNILQGHTMAAIRSQITGYKGPTAAYQEWYTCLKDIWNGDSAKIRIQKGLKNSFLKSLNQLPQESKRSIEEQVKAFDMIFYPIIASMEYREWKQDDAAMIDHIPFILTYSENAYMVIPFTTGDNTDLFGNVAAPTVVNPARVLYLCMLEDIDDLAELRENLARIVKYMGKKNLKSKIEIVLIYNRKDADLVSKEWEETIYALGDKRILHPIKHLVYDLVVELPAMVSEYLSHRSKGKSLFALERNTSRLSGMLQVSGVDNKFASYQFNAKNAKFFCVNGCDAFGYIKKPVYITVADMLSFSLSTGDSGNQPEFFAEYKLLWKKYSEKPRVWKALCDVLGKHSEKADILAVFPKKNPREKQFGAKEYSYTLPFECCSSAMRILNFLKSHDIVEQGSFVSGYTTHSCQIYIVDQCGYKEEYDKLFSNVYALMADDALSISFDTRNRNVSVRFDNLVVSGIQLIGGQNGEILSLLEFFDRYGYIINMKAENTGKISFTYATRQIKELLTTAGKMLEVHTYHKAKELGQFDDIVSSYMLEWEDTSVQNEFDCILTKGFQTLFVECKARTDLDQNFYYKLAQLTEKFGINTTAVLIADTQEKPFYDHAPVNAMQRKRGRMLDVVTIWKQDEINNIGHTLLRILNGNYVNEEESIRISPEAN